MKRRSNGFTLIEMMVVIGIILILMVLAVVGYQVVEKSAAANQTKVTLNNLNAMLAELDAAAGSSALPTYTYTSGGITYTLYVGAVDYTMLTPVQPPPMIPPSTLIKYQIGDVTSGGPDRYPNPNPNTYPGSPPVNIMAYTQQFAMAALMRVPGNANAIKQMPSSRIMKDQNGNPYQTPIILDGWGNPIIYVPATGISVYVTTGSGGNLVTIKSPSNRPFFASAGPDGDFGAAPGAVTPTIPIAHGDDNVYSKE